MKLRWEVEDVSLNVRFMSLRTSMLPPDKSEGPLGIIRKLYGGVPPEASMESVSQDRGLF